MAENILNRQLDISKLSGVVVRSGETVSQHTSLLTKLQHYLSPVGGGERTAEKDTAVRQLTDLVSTLKTVQGDERANIEQQILQTLETFQ